MLNFKQFNESIKNVISPKSDDDILKKINELGLDKLPPVEKARKMSRYRIPDKFLPPKEDIYMALGTSDLFDDIVNGLELNQLPLSKYYPSDEEIKDYIRTLPTVEQEYIKLCDKIFDDVSNMFKGRFFPLKVKLRRSGEYNINISLALGLGGRMSYDEETKLIDYIENISKDNNISIWFSGDSHGGRLVYEKHNAEFPERSEDYMTFPPPLYPDRLD